jgi:hypothetical protein
MYKLNKDTITQQIVSVSAVDSAGLNMSIPFDAANRDYQQFIKDLKDDVELLDADGNPADQGTIKALIRG